MIVQNEEREHEQTADCLPQQRQRLILERLAGEGRVVAQELAQRFGTSEDTIRRDLRELAAAGLCKRVYGGALPLSPASGSIVERLCAVPERKQALGEVLASLLPAGQVVFIDAGSTNLAAVHALPPSHPLTIITNAPLVAAEAASREGIELIVIGGCVDRRTGAAVGSRALRDVADLRPDVFVLGTCALDADCGIAAFGCEEAEFKRAVIEKSRRVISAATTDKLGTCAPFAVAPISALSEIVLEADVSGAQIAMFQSAGVEVHQPIDRGGS
jgi:DeoR/GlpR family transcriptional regulator of sugar metabolism